MIERLSLLPAVGRAVPILAVLLFAACDGENPVSITIMGSDSQSVTVPAGTEFSVTLQTVGPGEYSSPPAISSDAVRFVTVSLVSPYVPAGPTQRFQFAAMTRGKAVIVFQHTGNDREVQDTVDVR